MLHALGRAGDVGDHADGVLLVVEDVHQLDARVVAALEVLEGGLVGVAPHRGGAVAEDDTPAEADCGAPETEADLRRTPVLPGVPDADRELRPKSKAARGVITSSGMLCAASAAAPAVAAQYRSRR